MNSNGSRSLPSDPMWAFDLLCTCFCYWTRSGTTNIRVQCPPLAFVGFEAFSSQFARLNSVVPIDLALHLSVLLSLSLAGIVCMPPKPLDTHDDWRNRAAGLDSTRKSDFRSLALHLCLANLMSPHRSNPLWVYLTAMRRIIQWNPMTGDEFDLIQKRTLKSHNKLL